MSHRAILRMENISKSFPGVQALDEVSLEVRKGEVHAILGENGAGKSTLMKILSGAYHKDGGRILLEGAPVEIGDPREASRLGIAMIYQEFNLAPHLSVESNIYIGREPRLSFFGLVDQKKIHQDASALIAGLGVELDCRLPVGRLNVCQQQITEIAKALSMKARVMIMDEPTSALTETEVKTLFQVIRRLKRDGIGIIYISHNLEEVFEIADRITVLRDGRNVGTSAISELTPEAAVLRMVGRTIEDMYARQKAPIGAEVLQVEGLSCGSLLRGVSFRLHRGEILGIAGLLGSGRTELARAIFGVDRKAEGTIRIEGRPASIRRVTDAIRAGIGLVPEDRKLQGLFLGMPVAPNISAASLRSCATGGFLSKPRESTVAREQVRRLNIKVTGLEQPVVDLSGGNQQKVVLSRWLALSPKILLLDDPTRGIDIGAKHAIYGLMGDLARAGVGIIFISSELPEILGIADRILVMSGGRVRGELSAEEATQEKILSYATIGRGSRRPDTNGSERCQS
jgi:ribose transport system ATP-binding protein